MCGIVGYTGRQQAAGIIVEGLKRLEYRGYDSAGICTLHDAAAQLRRSEGKLANLERLLLENPAPGCIGIGHTRWATHGRPSDTNAHPHKAGPVAVVHNGIIENYLELREMLASSGHRFKSETDTEVVAHLIEEKLARSGDLVSAVQATLSMIRGAYALCILCENHPDTLVAAKKGAPLVVGLGEAEFFVASDIPALLSHTRTVVFLEDGEMATFRQGAVNFTTHSGATVSKQPRHIDWPLHMAEKDGYRHFMLKEIFEQPRAISDTLAGRLLKEQGDVQLEHVSLSDQQLRAFSRICIIACGTSWHAALAGKYLIEKRCRLPVEVDIASEFRYRDPVIDANTLLLAISQSGETADTLAAVREATRLGATCICICNVVDSSIARESAGAIYTHAGPEIGVASTKAFVTQLVALNLLTIRLGRARGTVDQLTATGMINSLVKLPLLVEEVLQLNETIEKTARNYLAATDFLYLGRGVGHPIALEGALKLKEISYIHAEGYPAGEMKHGPIALIDERMPVVVLAPQGRHYEKVCSNMEEVMARGGRVLAIASHGETQLHRKAEVVLEIPKAEEDVEAILLTVPLQLLAYHIATLKGTDVDQPRNLAKSVTVE